MTMPLYLSSVCALVLPENGSLMCRPYMHEGKEALVLLLPALDKLQSEGLVTAESAYCMHHLFLLFSAELEKKFKQGLTGQTLHCV